MNRRHVLLVLARGLAGLTAGALGVPQSRAEEPTQKVVRVGWVGAGSPSNVVRGVAALWERLDELGYVEGRNLVAERRWAEGRYERLPALMSELVERKADVIVSAATPAAIAAKKATSTIPIVVVAMGDPVRNGLVESLARPGGNLTGLSMGFAEGLSGKWLELLQETVPRLSTVAVIANPANPALRDLIKDVEAIAPKRRLRLRMIAVREPEALDRAFNRARREAQAALVLGDGALLLAHRQRVTALATKYRLPSIYNALDFVDAGGLMAYAADLAVMYRRAAEYVDKILRGAKPADLPVEQPTRYTLAINLKTAKALGLTIPQSILVRADEVIR